MVTTATSLGRSGLQDWLLQRFSALILISYTVFLIYIFKSNSEITFSTWQAIFSLRFVKLFTMLAIFSLIIHAWIGMWTVSTDYMKPLVVRLTFQAIVSIAFLGFLAWAVIILWGY